MQRYFGEKKQNKIIISKDNIHHIKKVMRMNIGDKIEVICDQKGYICKINTLKDNNLDLEIVDVITSNNELPIDITIAQALVPETKMDYILQKGTELGMSNFIPVIMERSIVKINHDKALKKNKRWFNICKEASEQSKRNIIPNVYDIHKLNDLLTLDYDLKILCSVNEKVKTIKSILHNIKEYGKIIIVIGPEGGISNQEEAILIKNGFIKVSLGTRVLRTETVVNFVLSVINYEFMR